MHNRNWSDFKPRDVGGLVSRQIGGKEKEEEKKEKEKEALRMVIFVPLVVLDGGFLLAVRPWLALAVVIRQVS